MRILDFHTHIYPDAIAKKATQSICDFYALEGGGMTGTPQELLEVGGLVGIEKYVVLPVGLKPNHVHSINSFILEQTAAQPAFIGFGTVHAGMEALCQEVQFILDSGLHGIKMHPDTQLFNIDDQRLFPVYDMLQDKIPVMFHMGDTRYSYSHPARLRRVLELFPRLKTVAAHFGGYSMYQTAYEELFHKDCLMDVSSSLMFLSPEEAVRLIRVYGPDRLVFGSDFPLWNPAEEVARFLRLPLTEGELEQIAWKTGHALLNLPENL